MTTSLEYVRDLIIEALEVFEDDRVENGEERKVRNMRTFQDAGLMTRDEGIVITMEDGDAFQVTIVRGR